MGRYAPLFFSFDRLSIRLGLVYHAGDQVFDHRLRGGFPSSGIVPGFLRSSGLEFLAGLFWPRSALRRTRFHLAAVHLSVSARRHLAHPHQHVLPLDVWKGRGASLGCNTVLHLLFCVRHRRGNHQCHCKSHYEPVRAWHGARSHHWSLRRDFWRAAGGGDTLSASARVSFPVAMSMRVFVLVMGVIEFFGTLGVGGDNVSHVCHLGGMLAGYLYLRRGSYWYGYRNRYADWKRRRLMSRFEVYKRKHRGEPPRPPDNWVN